MIYEVDFLPVGHLGRGSIAECLFFWMKGKILSRNSGPIASGATAPSAGDQCGAEDDQQQPGNGPSAWRQYGCTSSRATRSTAMISRHARRASKPARTKRARL